MSPRLTEQQGVRVAIEGCGHGTLNDIYASVDYARKSMNWTGVDLLIIGGDFQSVRNIYDLNCVNVPLKYRHMGDFHEYYSGARTAPYLTIFVGGNHEASNYLFELYFGGWVAPNIYYMGAANVLRFGPLRIMGMSGIWKGHDYRKPHHERLPYSKNDVTSIYHVRELDVRKLLQIRTQVDIAISHDWPSGVEWEGNYKQLFKFKPYFEEDANNMKLGSIAGQLVLARLRPRYWFSAHLHCEYSATIHHEERSPPNNAVKPASDHKQIDLGGIESLGNGTQAALGSRNPTMTTNEEEIDLDTDNDDDDAAPLPQAHAADGNPHADDPALPIRTTGLNAEAARAALPAAFRRPEPSYEKAAPTHSEQITNTTTRFLALDKCLPKKRFLKLQEIPPPEDLTEDLIVARPYKLKYDREWLAITRTYALDEPIDVGDPTADVPKVRPFAEKEELIDKRLVWIEENLSEADLVVPENFQLTAPVFDHGELSDEQYAHVKEYPNPQTAQFCELLQVPNPLEISEADIRQNLDKGPTYVPPRERRDGFDYRQQRGNRGDTRGNKRGGYRGGNQGRGGGHRGRNRGRGGYGGGGGRGGYRNQGSYGEQAGYGRFDNR